MQQLEHGYRRFHKRKQALCLNRVFFVLMLVVSGILITFPPTPIFAQSVAPDPFACYGIADEYNGSGATDGLAIINRLDGTAQVIGSGTGTGGIEALAFVPAEVNGAVQQVMFAVADPTNPNTTSANTLGTVDLTTGVWSPLDASVQIGSGTGPDGATFDFSTGGDIDGLTWDVQRAILWATQRNGGDGNPDYLLQIDPATGQIVPNAFGAGIDWVPVPIADLSIAPDWNAGGIAYDDMDDLAVDPVSGRMFVILNKGGSGGGLLEINPADGTAINYLGLFNGTTSVDGIVDDMEGLAFFNDGQLYGSTGNNGPDAADLNQLFTINVDTGAATLVGAFPEITRDIEGLGCLTAPAFITLEKATNGVDADQPTGPNVPLNGAVAWTYVIENTGAVPLLNMTLSDDVLGDISNSCAEGALPDPFNAGETFTCTVSGTADIAGQYENLGTVEALFEAPTEGGLVSIPLSAQDPSHYFGLLPGISIVKTAGDAADGDVYTASSPGPVTFTYLVENTGNTFLSDMSISDDAGTAGDTSDDILLTSAECADLAGPLAPTATVTCTADITVSGNATNIATTSGNPTDENGTDLPDVAEPTDDDPAEVVVPQPAIEIIKTAGDAADGETYTISAPGMVTFIYTVNNTGSTYLSDITITDDAGTADAGDDVLLTSAECADLAGPLAPDASVVCTADIMVNGDVTNVAGTTGNPTDADGNDLPDVPDPTDNDPADVVYAPGIPGISIVKIAGDAADGEIYTAPGPGPVVFTYVVQNTGGTHLVDLVIADDAGTASDASDDVTITSAECAGLAGPLAPSASVTCTAEIEVNDDATNVATVTGIPSDPEGTPLPGVDPPTADDPADVVVPEAGIEIIKTAGDAADGETYTISAPGMVTFIYTAKNTGGTYLSAITITDDAATADTSDDLLLTSAECADLAGPLAPGGSVSCTAEIMVDGDATNVAGTTGNPTDEDGNDLPGVDDPTDDDPADVVYAPGTPGIEIVKTAGDAADGDVLTIGAPQLVTFNYAVTNTGDTYLSEMSISDDAGTPSDTSDDVLLTSAECADLSGPLAPGGSVSCTAEIMVDGDATNVAGTTGNPTDEDGNDLPGVDDPTDDDPADVVYAPGIPGIQIVKTAGDAADNAIYNAGTPGLVVFTYAVKNTGGTYLTDMTISDDAGTPTDSSDDVTVTSAECADLAGPLAPGDTVLCTADIQVNGDAVNNANTTGTPSDEAGNPLPDVDPPTSTDDAEVVMPGSIGDTVWMDTNGDGVQDPNEMGISGVTIILTLPDGSVITTVTDENGSYLFPDLSAGDYSVAVDVSTLPTGLEQTFDADGLGTGNSSSLTLSPGENNLDQDFGYLLLGPGIQLEKTVYAGHDSGAGCPGGELETGADQPITYCFEISNIGDTYLNDIELNDADLGITEADMALLSGEEPLAPGAKMVFYYETELEEDLINTADVTGTPSDSAGNPIPGLPRPIDQDIAQVKTVASLGNYVWFDRNADGSQDSSEAGLENVTVHLLDADGNILETTTTDATGFYHFDNLTPGNYAVQVETPIDGYMVSPMDNAADAFDSDIDPVNGRTVVITLDPNENDNTIDAGFTAPPQLEIVKRAEEDATQPGAVITYQLTYSNRGVGDAAGVVVTEVVPRDTTFLPQLSSPGWVCESGSTQAGTICSFEIGFIPAGTVDAGTLMFVVQTNSAILEKITIISNQVIISDDGTNGPQIAGQTVDSFDVDIQRPTSIDVDFEPGFSGGSTERVFLPFVGRRLRSDGTPYTLTVDQRVMSWICAFMDDFGWTSDSCFVPLE